MMIEEINIKSTGISLLLQSIPRTRSGVKKRYQMYMAQDRANWYDLVYLSLFQNPHICLPIPFISSIKMLDVSKIIGVSLVFKFK